MIYKYFIIWHRVCIVSVEFYKRVSPMLKNITIAVGVTALLGATMPAQAVTITYDHSHDSLGLPTSIVAGALVNNFDTSNFTDWNSGPNPVLGTIASGGGFHFVTGDVSGKYAAPFISDGPIAGSDDPTVYLSIPSSSSSGDLTLLLDKTFDYFGLFWGSIDTYNSISFLMDGVTVGSYSGTDVINPNAANGNQTAPSTNTYVNFFDLPAFNAVKLASAGYAFELDNIALATLTCTSNCGGTGTAIPEPATFGLFGLGLVSLGLAARRRSTKPERLA